MHNYLLKFFLVLFKANLGLLVSLLAILIVMQLCK